MCFPTRSQRAKRPAREGEDPRSHEGADPERHADVTNSQTAKRVESDRKTSWTKRTIGMVTSKSKNVGSRTH